MAASKAGINSQSGERLGALDSTGLTGTTVAEQLAELKLLIEESGGSVLVPTFFSGTMALGSGLSGTIITIPAPPAGQRVVLSGLSATITNSNVSVVGSISGVRIDNKELDANTASANRFSIGQSTNTAAGSAAGVLLELVFEPDEVVTVTKTGVATSGSWYYSYYYAKDS